MPGIVHLSHHLLDHQGFFAIFIVVIFAPLPDMCYIQPSETRYLTTYTLIQPIWIPKYVLRCLKFFYLAYTAKYTFPPQPLVISACAELARRLIVGEPVTEQKPLDSWITTSKETNAGKQQPKERTLVVVG